MAGPDSTSHQSMKVLLRRQLAALQDFHINLTGSPGKQREKTVGRTTVRIISGTARGIRLAKLPPQLRAIRPTSDRCREALFSILGKKVDRARILDLFAGTGALGIEALSRGASSAVFIDHSKTALQLVQKNLTKIFPCFTQASPKPQAHIFQADLDKQFPGTVKKLRHTCSPFDLLFVDPPYEKGLSLKTLQALGDGDLLSSAPTLIVEEKTGIELPQQCKNLYLSDLRTYGDTTFWFYSSARSP